MDNESNRGRTKSLDTPSTPSFLEGFSFFEEQANGGQFNKFLKYTDGI
jgi:hypothetical protein